MSFKSKLPKKIQDSLAKEMRALFTGKVENIKVKISFDYPFKVGYGWGEGTSAHCNFQPLESRESYTAVCHKIIDQSINKIMQPKLDKIDARIKRFYIRLDKLSKKYKTDSDSEFNYIYSKYKLADCDENWR